MYDQIATYINKNCQYVEENNIQSIPVSAQCSSSSKNSININIQEKEHD